MELQDRAREIAEEAKKRTATASRRGRGTSETVARETAKVGTKAGEELVSTAKSMRESVESVHSRVNGTTPVETDPDPSEVATTSDGTTAMLALEIRQFLERVDHRYAAKSGLEGARHGYTAGPYGAVFGAGAGTVYGAYTSTRAAFDPENPPKIGEGFEAERYLDGARHARTGYEVGKRFGTKGKVAGTAVGAGISFLPTLVERVNESMSHEKMGFEDERLRAVSEWMTDRQQELPNRLPLADHLGRGAKRTVELVSRNDETIVRLGEIAVETDWSSARRAATDSVAAVRDRTDT